MGSLSNQKIKFLSGSQSKLDDLRTNGGAELGAFYLTDTNRLYVGKTFGNLIIPEPVNQGVITVASVSVLPKSGEPGQFYFATLENVLCVYSKGKWIQINTDTYIDHLSSAVASVGTNGVSVTTKGTYRDGQGMTGTYDEKDTGFTVIGVNGITVTKNTSGQIVITAPNGIAYGLTAVANDTEAATKSVDLKLTGSDDIVNIHGDNDSVVVSKDDNGILITGPRHGIAKVEGNAVASGFTVYVQANDGTNGTATLNPQITYGSQKQSTVNFVNGVATLNVYTKAEVDELKRTFDAMEYHGTVETLVALKGKEADAHNGYVFKYTGGTEQIDDIKDDTAKSQRIISDVAEIHSGDLFIAYKGKATEDSEGILIDSGSNKWVWTHVPSGDDTDTQYSFQHITNGISLKPSTSNIVEGQFTVSGGNEWIANQQDTDLDISSSANSGRNVSIKLEHKYVNSDKSEPKSGAATVEALSATTNKNTTSLTIPVQTETFDAAGHVKTISTVNYTVVDSHNHINSDISKTLTTIDGANNSIKITPLVTMTDTDDSTGINLAFSIKSEGSLTVTGDNTTKTVNIDLLWGEF